MKMTKPYNLLYNDGDKHLTLVLDRENSSVDIEVVKISDKSDIKNMMKKCDHFIYFPHNYYKNVPCKLELLNKS